ncbi:MAG: 8-oxo-dGTP diphosphatase [Oscillospiraceae bacterium]|nr:8-oxo-dGTP diphosphatase [Oscillospiraceae bacterium]
MSRTEQVELTNMCMICDGKGNVLVQDKKNHPTWHGWNFPGGHVEPGEFVTPSVIREMQEETGLTIRNPKLCGIKEFHRSKDGKRYMVFLYVAREFEGELRSSGEGEVFWYPLAELEKSDRLIHGFGEMLPIFTKEELSEVFYVPTETGYETVLL